MSWPVFIFAVIACVAALIVCIYVETKYGGDE